MVSLSLGDGMDEPPPLPPRRGSGQASQARQGMWDEMCINGGKGGKCWVQDGKVGF